MKSKKFIVYTLVCLSTLAACKTNVNPKVVSRQRNKDSLYPGGVIDTFAARMRGRLLFLSNLEGYLSDTLNDYYIIYTINDKYKDPIFFSIKAQHGIASITFSRSHFDKAQLQNEQIAKEALDSFFQESRSVYRNVSDIDSLRDSLENFKKSLHTYDPAGFSENVTYVSYFDGKEHYSFSSGTVGFKVLDQIDSLFQNNKLFKSLMLTPEAK